MPLIPGVQASCGKNWLEGGESCHLKIDMWRVSKSYSLARLCLRPTSHGVAPVDHQKSVTKGQV